MSRFTLLLTYAPILLAASFMLYGLWMCKPGKPSRWCPVCMRRRIETK